MTFNQFNGIVKVLKINKNQNGTYGLELSFIDKSGLYFGYNTELGDVVFIRGLDGKAYRLIISEIFEKSHSFLNVKVAPASPISWFSLQTGVLVRETSNREFPMFPIGTPEVLQSAMLNHYAVLNDNITEGGSGGSVSNFYEHQQPTPSLTWIIPHNLGRKPNVRTIDSTGRRIYGSERDIDENLMEINFNIPVSGFAECS